MHTQVALPDPISNLISYFLFPFLAGKAVSTVRVREEIFDGKML
jgi:hypothetical protein